MKTDKQSIQRSALHRHMCAIMLALVILIGVMAGCTGPDDDTSGDSPTDPPATTSTPVPDDTSDGLPAPGVLPLVTEPVTLTIGIAQHALTTNYEDNYFTKLLEDETGVSFDFELYPTDATEAKQKVTLAVSSNQELPDILCMGFTDAERATYGSSGTFLPLNDYIENDAFYFHEVLAKWASPDEKEDLLKFGTSPDGNIYAFPTYIIDPGDSSALGMWINKKWLDNLELAVPTTTDELYDVLLAFRDEDANGNGDLNDEIPVTGISGNVAVYLLNSFIYTNYQKLNVDESGQLYAPFVKDEWREGMRYVNKLAEEELLSPITFSQTQNELRAILSDPTDADSIIGAFCGHPSPLFGGDGVPRVMEYLALPAMIGPEGVNWTPNNGWFGSYTTQITSSCENPELAFRVIDVVSREDLSLSCRFGEQDVDWKYTEEGNPAHVLEGYSVVFEQLQTVWTTENDKIWHSNFMNQIPPKLFGGSRAADYPNEYRHYQMRDLWYETVPLRFDNHPEKLVNRLIYTLEEIEAISDIQTTIETYVAEARARFTLGNLDIENDWESYLSELDAMQLSKYIEISQQAYDRMNK